MISRQAAFSVVFGIAELPHTGGNIRHYAMEQLYALDGYDWCGVYKLEGDNLILAEYCGDETDHTVIPVGQGVCGTAVEERFNQTIQDVRKISNYLSCSVKTRSEIVVLIKDKGKILGIIDVDGHQLEQFDETDEAMLTEVASTLAARWE